MSRKDKLEAGLEDLFSKSEEEVSEVEPQNPIEPPVEVEPVESEALEAETGAASTEEASTEEIELAVSLKPEDVVHEEASVEAPSVDASAGEASASEASASEASTIEASIIEGVEPLVSLEPEDVAQEEVPLQGLQEAEARVAKRKRDVEAVREVQLVAFMLANEAYGVDIAAVDQIIELSPITVVPHTPAYIAGLTNLRGTVLPVVDLRRRFGLPIKESTQESRIIVANLGGNKVGLIVDAVTEVRRVPETSIEPPSPLLSAVDSAYVIGIVKTDERLIALLDLDYVLSASGSH